MTSYRAIIRTLLLPFLFALNNPAHADNTAIDVYKKVSESVFLVKNEVKNGTIQGSAVAYKHGYDVKTRQPDSTYLATNAHVTKESSKVVIIQNTRNGEVSYIANVQYKDDDLDIAIIKIDTPIIKTAKLNTERKINIGESVYAIGSPLGMENSLTSGIVSGLRIKHNVNTIQTSAPISNGNSGGGLFDKNGFLIGITTFKLKGGENINFAIRSDNIIDLDNAQLAATMIVSAIDSVYNLTPLQFNAINSNKFAKWLFDNVDENGRRLSDQIYQNTLERMEMVYKGTLSAENFFAENYKLIKLFLSQQPEFKPSYSSRYAEPGEAKPIPSLLQPKKTSKRLECEGNSIYGEPSFFTVNIDFEKKLVNYSSEDIIEFNDTSIKYKLIKIIAHIKRTTGKYTWSLNDKIIASGTCTIVEKNAF